ncbi:MAG TPA: winged helix-turn-helix domain-containing protein, partial [Mycobacteriales bacterium]|nr:winged helix-turn-helix domain-containing protein [Mycobacteriales bacterium]
MSDDDAARDRPAEPHFDPRAMRALAHPLRMALIEVLAIEGTATRCAELLHESQANCSFHLRTLARYGFVEEAPSHDRRERPWRVTSREQSWPSGQPEVASAVAADQLSRVFVHHRAAARPGVLSRRCWSKCCYVRTHNASMTKIGAGVTRRSV